MQRKLNLTQWFVYEWGKPPRQKSHRMIFRSPFPKLHYYHNKQIQVKESQYLIPTYSWTLTPISNWTCSVVTVPLFNAWLSSTWLSANLDSTYCVCVYWSCVFILFIFFFSRVFGGMRLLFNEQCMNSSRKCWLFPMNSASVPIHGPTNFTFQQLFH